MIDKDSVDIAKEVTKEIAKDVYNDTGKPILQPTGELVGLIPRAIKAALGPLEKWVLQKEYNIEETKRLLENKLQNVNPEMIEAPEPYIAVPALQSISYCMDNEELRNMYANLLANSMNKVVKKGVHPGFVEIIKQLCPDEAKLLNYLYINEKIPTISFIAHQHIGGFSVIKKGFTNATELCGCESPFEYEKYIDNLVRLGLLRRSNNEMLINEKLYEPLNTHPYITGLKKQIEANEEINNRIKEIELSKGFIELTSFGKGFCLICLNAKE